LHILDAPPRALYLPAPYEPSRPGAVAKRQFIEIEISARKDDSDPLALGMNLTEQRWRRRHGSRRLDH
jgi:hypothetical protein